MRFLSLWLPAVTMVLIILVMPIRSHAQNDSGLADLLGELLRGVQEQTQQDNRQDSRNDGQRLRRKNGRDEPVQRRVPLGREDIQLSFAPLVRQTAPAVVNVYAKAEVRRPSSPFAGDPFFEQFFGGGRNARPRVQSSLGSGVIVDSSGLVVTNFHVIKGADEVKVALADGREFESEVLLRDESVDLAILKIDARAPLPFLRFGDSDALEVGDLVLAIGNPFGVGQTTTSGIVSALARSHVGVSDFGFFIQTDAAINPGNSGGALINMAGELIGVNTAIFTRSGGSNGIGFAIPSIMVRAVTNAARNGGDYLERPYLGAEFVSVDAQTANALGLSRAAGALVQNVTPGSPADKGRMRPGDIVLTVDGRTIEHPDALGYRLATSKVGATLEMEVLRRGRLLGLQVTLERAPSGGNRDVSIEIQGDSPFAGAKIANLSPRLAQRLRLPETKKGVVIVDLARGSPSQRFGFRPGDVVVELNGENIRDANQLNRLAMERSRWWRFAVDRNGQILRQVLRY